jgi:hypothetical protein
VKRSSIALAAALLAVPAWAQQNQKCIVSHRGEAVEQQTQRGVWEHKVYLRNGCNKTVNVRVCYEGTKSCVLPDVRAGQERMTTLGIKRGESRFQYRFWVQD